MSSSIWHDQKLIFIHPIKTAGTSLFHNLLEVIGGGDFHNEIYPHRTLWEIRQAYPKINFDEYFKVMTVRHPVARILSWIRWHATHGTSSPTVKVAMTHVRSLVHYGLPQMDFLVNQETFEQDARELQQLLGLKFKQLHHLNPSNKIDIEIADDELAFILNRFRRDIDLIQTKKWERDVCPRLHRTYDIDGEPSGWLAALWNCHEDNWRPDQVYLTVVSPGGRKGPHLHAKRVGRFFCIRGRVRVTTRNAQGLYWVGHLDSAWPQLFEVPTGAVAEFYNAGDDSAYLLNMPTPAWRPDDQDELTVENWNPPTGS